MTRDYFVPQVLKAIEKDGKLYELPTSFSVQTAYALSSIASQYDTWNVAAVQDAMTQLQEGATVFSTGWTKCEHRSCSGWTSSTARGRTTMACSSSVLAMIMARKVQSAPSTAIMPWGVELL